jgi:hypothetical protein
MNKNILFTVFFSTMSILLADPGWEDDPGAYEFVATISGGIILSDGVNIAEEGDIFAAFDDAGNVRGVAGQISPSFGDYMGETLYEMTLRSNTAGDILSFKYYDASEDAVLNISETYEFVINDIIGNLVVPVFYNIGAGEEECVDTDEVCSWAPAQFGCDFSWGGTLLSELCPLTCDTCPGGDVEGCTNPDAANYNPDATIDDGSCCLDTDDVCSWAPAQFGCDFSWGGTPLNELCPVTCDTCPGGDVEGCMDESACNYNPDATVDDVYF